MRALLCLLLTVPAVCFSATFTVTNGDDSGAGSLRQALLDVKNAGGANTVQITFTGDIVLTGVGLTIGSSTEIVGPGAESLRIGWATPAPQNVLTIVTGSSAPTTVVTVSGVTLRNGMNGLRISSANVTLDHVIIEDSGHLPSYRGAGINIFGETSLTIRDSVIRNNQGSLYGGGIDLGPAGIQGTPINLTIERTSFVGNHAEAGGAICLTPGTGLVTALLRNVTISGNGADTGTSANRGGGIYLLGGATGSLITLENCTITANTVSSQSGYGGGGISVEGNPGAVLTLKGTIVYGNTAPSYPELQSSVASVEHAGMIVSAGYNMVGNAGSDTWSPLETDYTGVSPQLLPLTDSGFMPVHPLALTSPAIDQAATVGILTDARGLNRVVDAAAIPNGPNGGNGADIGAYEVNPTLTVAPTSLDLGSALGGQPTEGKSFSLSGTELFGSVTCSAPKGFEVSAEGASGFAPAVTVSPDLGNGGLSPTMLLVRAQSASAGPLTGDLSCASDGAPTVHIALNGAIKKPLLTLSATTLVLSATETGKPVDGSYAVSGSDLVGPVMITASAGFNVSLAPEGPFATTATTAEPDTAGVLAPTTVYVRFVPSDLKLTAGSITHSSPQASDVLLSVAGGVGATSKPYENPDTTPPTEATGCGCHGMPGTSGTALLGLLAMAAFLRSRKRV